jgi:hypothetical protein
VKKPCSHVAFFNSVMAKIDCKMRKKKKNEQMLRWLLKFFGGAFRLVTKRRNGTARSINLRWVTLP